VRFLRQRPADSTISTDPADAEVENANPERVAGKGFTPGKGRPTPKRRDAQVSRRGPAPAPPRNQREAMRRSRGDKEQRRQEAALRRERMAAGDDKYVLPRDKGPVRAFVRDLVDSRRHLVGLFMPLALVVLVVMIAPMPALQYYAAPVTMMILVAMVIEGVFLGRLVTNRVRAKFPDTTDRGLSLGWYAFVRASQIRRLRLPKPRTKPGDVI